MDGCRKGVKKMILDKKPAREKIEIDLTGPEGNVFVLIGIAKNISRQLKRDPKPIIDEMTSGDYENAVQTLEKYFGEYVIMYRG
jgi:ABC-type uncharacterized transport system substrate-binding protein